MTTKIYPAAVALSAASGRLLCAKFADVHELVTDLAGWPVMSHHMADRGLMDAVAAKVIHQVPWMPGAVENIPTFPSGEGVEAAIKAFTTRIAAAHGDIVELELGDPLPTLSLFHGLAR
jgi:hypothetical protein